MTWSGETSRGRAPGPRTPWPATRGPAGLSPWLSGRSPPTAPPSGPQNPPDDKKWCYPAHAWASDPGLLQVPLALTREYAALGTTTHRLRNRLRRLSQKTQIGDASTTGSEQPPRRHRPPRRLIPPSRPRPSPAGDHPSRPPPAPPSLPSLPTFLSLLFLPSFSLCPWLSSPAPGTPRPPETPD